MDAADQTHVKEDHDKVADQIEQEQKNDPGHAVSGKRVRTI